MPSPYQNWSHGPTPVQEGQEVQSHTCPEGEEPEMFNAQTCDRHLPQEWSWTYPVSVSMTWRTCGHWVHTDWREPQADYLSGAKPGSKPRGMGSWNIKQIPGHRTSTFSMEKEFPTDHHSVFYLLGVMVFKHFGKRTSDSCLCSPFLPSYSLAYETILLKLKTVISLVSFLGINSLTDLSIFEQR